MSRSISSVSDGSIDSFNFIQFVQSYELYCSWNMPVCSGVTRIWAEGAPNYKGSVFPPHPTTAVMGISL